MPMIPCLSGLVCYLLQLQVLDVDPVQLLQQLLLLAVSQRQNLSLSLPAHFVDSGDVKRVHLVVNFRTGVDAQATGVQVDDFLVLFIPVVLQKAGLQRRYPFVEVLQTPFISQGTSSRVD